MAEPALLPYVANPTPASGIKVRSYASDTSKYAAVAVDNTEYAGKVYVCYTVINGSVHEVEVSKEFLMYYVYRSTGHYAASGYNSLNRSWTLDNNTLWYHATLMESDDLLNSSLPTLTQQQIFAFFFEPKADIPVTYIGDNVTLNGPEFVASGANVVVNVVFDTGYGFTSNSDIYVTYNGNIVQSTYNSSTNTLTFTAPVV